MVKKLSPRSGGEFFAAKKVVCFIFQSPQRFVISTGPISKPFINNINMGSCSV